MINYFPTHLALGRSFCNRRVELERLIYNIKTSNPTLIMSPRRYGKTSLALNTIQQSKIPFAHIDLYKELSEDDIQIAILNGIGRLISQFETTPKRLMKLATDLFSNLEISIILEKPGIKFEFNKYKQKTSNIIFESLEKLHESAKRINKKAIFYMDEFQVLGEITKDHAIEAAIRESAQKSSHIAYVFSGSNRHLMQQMFYDKKRPFYKLCDVIILDRISENAYEPYIQKAALEKWNKKLSNNTLENIFSISEKHPYYVNKLCSLIWMGKYPDENLVKKIWHQYVLENKSIIEREINLLSLNQRKLLIYLANHNTVKEFFSKDFSYNLNMSVSSVSQSLNALYEKDYLGLDIHNHYKILDPLIKAVFSSI